MIEKILDKIDKWDTEIGIWSLGSASREIVVFGLHWILAIPLAFLLFGIIAVVLLFFWWATGTLLGIWLGF